MSTETFAELYSTYFPAATGLARSLTQDHAAAEDIAAEGLLRVWQHWDSGTVIQPWGYIRRTVINETISRARRSVREKTATARLRPAAPVHLEDSVSDRDLVIRLLDELPPRQRQIVALRFVEDLSERETAQRLGISTGAVKSATSRGLARLRAAMASDSQALAA